MELSAIIMLIFGFVFLGGGLIYSLKKLN
ncbi:MetS family NSS transporter small subunit [Natranaerovirga pectinivora]